MPDNSTNSKRIAKNTLVLYFRMLFLMVVTLYTCRVILEALGVEDYGIYNVVGGFVSMFALISAALTSACSRFLNFEMGKGDPERQNVVFSTAVTIQWMLAIIVLVIAEVFGIWYVNNIMVIPVERLTAANWCFQFSVLTFCMNLITVPYNASIIAHEKMKTFAYVSIYEGLAKLGISILIFWDPFDRLVFYALMLFIVQFTVRYSYQFYCRRNFAECYYKRVFDKLLLKNMLSYSVWHFVGNGATVLKNHGVNIVLNLFFGPTVNAAKGVSNQVENAVRLFAGNFMLAMNPQITQSYARGNLSDMFNLINKGTRFCYYLLLIITLPVAFNIDYILYIWLKHSPKYTAVFIVLSLVCMLIGSLSTPLITAQNATGNVRNYQLVVGGILLLNLPLSFCALRLGFDAEIVIYVAILVEVLALVARMYMIPRTIDKFKPFLFVKNVIFNCLLVTLASLLMPSILFLELGDSLSIVSFVIMIVTCLFSTSLAILFVGCNHGERKIIFEKIKVEFNKIIRI